VLAALPPGLALVSYANYEPVTPWPLRPDGTRVWLPAAARTMVFVAVGGASGVHALDLGPADSLAALAARWARLATRRPAPAQRVRAERAYREVGAALRARVWDPVTRWLAGTPRVLLVPEGALHLVNFAALPAASGGFLIENGPALQLLSAERDLAHFRTPHAAGRGLALFGAAAFGAAKATDPTPGAEPSERDPLSDCVDFRALRFGPLPATQREVEEVRLLWRSAPTLTAGDSVLVRTGTAATEHELKRLGPGRRALHLATHGFFLPARCPQVKPGAPLENPLLRAGLALSGANRRTERHEQGEDGILTAEEIAGLDLEAVEWAVLSACHTGAGDPKVGEGVLGMRRAFQVAGVRTVVMNLWSVDDEVGRRFVELLYRARWVRGVDTMSAMREATLELLSERRAAGRSTHPYYWASFVAAGDWR
jgi:CHAT domain-containing protein